MSKKKGSIDKKEEERIARIKENNERKWRKYSNITRAEK
jgi:hypothetical protein